MDYLGLFCLGAFVGAIATVGLSLIRDLTDWKQVLVVILPAVLSGAAMVLVDKFKYSPALGCYPLGLIAALMWGYIGTAIDNIKSPETTRKIIGLAHASASFLITLAAAVFAALPAIQQVRAEMDQPLDVRRKELLEARARANASPLVLPASAAAAAASSASAAASSAQAAASSASAALAAASAASSRTTLQQRPRGATKGP